MTGSAEGRARLDAVVLAGGRSSRLGGHDKAGLLIDGRRLVDRTVEAALAAGATRCVVAGPATLRTAVPVVQEQPPFGGPVAGLAAALAALPGPPGPSESGGQPCDVLVLACDLADPEAAVAALLGARAADGDAEGLHLVDADGRPQWLTGLYRREALDVALGRLGDPAGRSARDLLAGTRLRGVAASAAADIDTWEDLSRARREEDR